MRSSVFSAMGHRCSQQAYLLGTYRCVMSAVFFADESSVFTASDDGIARMWDSSTGECKQELSTVKSGTSPHLRWGARGQGLDPSPAPSNPPWGFSSTSGGVVWVDDRGPGHNGSWPHPLHPPGVPNPGGRVLCREVAGGIPSTTSRQLPPPHGPPLSYKPGVAHCRLGRPWGVRAASALSLGRYGPASRPLGGSRTGHRSGV